MNRYLFLICAFFFCLGTTTAQAANFLQDSGTQGLVSLDAVDEHNTIAIGGSKWSYIYDTSIGYDSDQALKAKPDTGVSYSTGFVGASPRFDFRVEFVQTGTHYVWILGLGVDANGNEVHVGLNGAADANADNIEIPTPYNQVNWSNGSHTINVPNTGSHDLNIWMGEDGVSVDKIVLTTDPNYVPTGNGPGISAQIGPVAKWFKQQVLPQTTGNVITAMSNDYHTEGSSFWITSVQQNWGTYGTLTVSSSGDSLLYDAPNPGSGNDETVHLTYTVTDAAGRIGEATGVIAVTDNTVPVAVDDAYTVTQDSSTTTFNVLANDSDPDNDPIHVHYLWSPNQGGTAVINAAEDGIEYTPAAGFVGTETVKYKISDDRPFGYVQATVTVTVTASGANQSPVAVDDAFTVNQDTTNNALAVLVGAGADSDPDSDPLTVTAVGATDNGGTAVINGAADGITYTPAVAFVGTETFTYTISDGNGGTDTATVTMTVASINTAPVAVDDAYTVNQDTTDNAFAVLVNDTDADTDPLTVTAVGATDNGGTAVINGTSDGITYTPATAFVGTETFSYTASDGNGGTDTATVTVTVDAVVINVPPVLNTIGNQSVAEGSPLTIAISATDPDGPSPLTLTQVNSLPGSPSILTDNGDGTGTLSWTPTTGDAAGSPYSITVTASDGLAQTDFETFSLTVTAPTATTVTYEHNALGQRVSKTNGTQVTHYLYDQAGQLIAEVDAGTGNTLREYVYVNGEQLAVIDDTDTVNEALYFVQNDHLGTPQQITDDTETVVWSADYAPFGQASILVNSIANNIRFPGQYEDDETGNHYNYFRTYDPTIGRYTQSDPIGLAGGHHRYAYAVNSPISAYDPLGLRCQSLGWMIECTVSGGGPTFQVPRPPGFPDQLDGGLLYHDYTVSVPLEGADPECVLQELLLAPTPGQSNGTSSGGTRNNAEVGGVPNFVTSYATRDVDTGNGLAVNTAGTNDGSLFGPGYVARYVSGGSVHTSGEGLNWRQAPWVLGGPVIGPLVQWGANEAVWGDQMRDIVERCSCE